MALLGCLHACDNMDAKHNPYLAKHADGSPLEPHERNWKAQPLQDLLEAAWQKYVDYTQSLSMDESMLKDKATMERRKQRMVAKPIKVGLKVFVVAAATSLLRGFVYCLSVYGGKGDGADNPAGAKVDYVTRLLPARLNKKGHVVTVDNYYGSEKLIKVLKRRGIETICTVNDKGTDFTEWEREPAPEGKTRQPPAIKPHEFRTAYKTIRTASTSTTPSGRTTGPTGANFVSDALARKYRNLRRRRIERNSD